MAGVVVALGFTGCSPCGAPHLGFGRCGSDVGLMMGTIDMCGLVWRARVMCVRSTLQG